MLEIVAGFEADALILAIDLLSGIYWERHLAGIILKILLVPFEAIQTIIIV